MKQDTPKTLGSAFVIPPHPCKQSNISGSRRGLRRWLPLGLALAAPLFFTACGSTKVTTASSASVGQQLQDLDKAYKDGLITDKEYQRLKRAVVKKND